tara:strand:+ start:3123 stop:3620 length:498 start_codon:yes stop_codon:yes gene_type:complete
MPQGKGTYGSKVGRPKKKGNPKNKNIMDTPMRKIPGALIKKAKQKVKNVLKNTPKQNIRKAVTGDANPYVKAYKKVRTAGKGMKAKTALKKGARAGAKAAARGAMAGVGAGASMGRAAGKVKVSKKTGRVSVGKTPGRKIVKRKPTTLVQRNKAKRNKQKKFLKK